MRGMRRITFALLTSHFTLHKAVCCQRMEAIRNSPRLASKQLGQTRVVRAKDERLARLPAEVRELAADSLKIGVEVEVFLVHVQHDGVMRTEPGQGAIAF